MNRYDNSPSKDASMAKTRQNRMEAEHSAKDAFVKKQQAELSKMGGKAPNLKAESLEFSSYMCNNGMHAQELASDLTRGIDHTAFPVKKA